MKNIKNSKKNQKKSKNWGFGGPKIEKNRVFRGYVRYSVGFQGGPEGYF